MFVLNAFAYSNVVPRLPAIKAELALSNTALGAAVAAMPVGALISGPFGGILISRFGSARVVVACAVALGGFVPLFAMAPTWPALAATFLVFGMADCLMDVTMNAQALVVQHQFGRSIINRIHGLWSIGAVAAGLIGSAAAGVALALEIHLGLVGAAVALAALVLRRWLVADPIETAPPPDVPVASRGRRGGILAVLGVLVLMSAIIEDTPASWGAVFMRTELGTSAAAAGAVFVAFQIAMTTSRFVGDRLVDRLGPATVLRLGGALIVVGMGAGLAIDEPVAVVAGFALAGIGAAPLFPLVFEASTNVAGVAAGHGLSAVSWLSRIGFLVSPPLVGAIGDATSLRAGLLVAPAAGVVVVLLSGAISGARRASRATR